MRKSHLNRRLEDVRKTLNASESAMYGLEETAGLDVHVEAERIVSSESSRYILIQGKDLGSSSQEESQEEDDERPKSPGTQIKGSSTSLITNTSASGSQVPSNIVSERSAMESSNSATHDKPLIEFDVASMTSSDPEEEEAATCLFPTHTVAISGKAPSPTVDFQLPTMDSVLSSMIITQEKEPKSDESVLKATNKEELDAKESHSVSLAQEDDQQHHSSVSEANPQSLQRVDIPVAKDEEKRKASIAEQSEEEQVKKRVAVVEKQVVAVEPEKEEEMSASVKKVSHMLELPAEAMSSMLGKEMEQLNKNVTQQEKRAAEVTDWMYSDAQVSIQNLAYIVNA